jgi:hypothetical protein
MFLLFYTIFYNYIYLSSLVSTSVYIRIYTHIITNQPTCFSLQCKDWPTPEVSSSIPMPRGSTLGAFEALRTCFGDPAEFRNGLGGSCLMLDSWVV